MALSVTSPSDQVGVERAKLRKRIDGGAFDADVADKQNHLVGAWRGRNIGQFDARSCRAGQRRLWLRKLRPLRAWLRGRRNHHIGRRLSHGRTRRNPQPRRESGQAQATKTDTELAQHARLILLGLLFSARPGQMEELSNQIRGL